MPLSRLYAGMKLEQVCWVARGKWVREHLHDGRGSTLCGKVLNLKFGERRITLLERVPLEFDEDFCAVCADIAQGNYGQ